MKADVNFKCHNCGASMTLSSFIKHIDPVLHKQYVFERFKDGTTGRATVVEEPKFEFKAPKFKKKLKLPKASEDPSAAGYLTARKLDPDNFYYAKKFKKFANSLKPTFESEAYDEERIIIPLYYEKNLIGFQGRSLGPSKVKYITVMLDDDAPKIYGLDNIRRDAPIYITEGPFVSTCSRNAVARLVVVDEYELIIQRAEVNIATTHSNSVGNEMTVKGSFCNVDWSICSDVIQSIDFWCVIIKHHGNVFNRARIYRSSLEPN